MRVFDVFKLKWAKKPPTTKNGQTVYAVFDIGTSMIKTAIIGNTNNKIKILGYSRVKQERQHMSGGVILDIEGVIKNLKKGFNLACNNVDQAVQLAVAGITGELVRGRILNITHERSHPEKQITPSEINQIIDRIERRAAERARKEIAWDSGRHETDIRLLHVNLQQIRIDGQPVVNPNKFQGRNIEFQIFHAFAPLVNVGAIQSVIQALKLQIKTIAATPFAIAYALQTEKSKTDAIIIDIGAGTTDVALIRNGGIEGSRSYALAGNSFTEAIMDYFNSSFEEAEEVKILYSKNKLENKLNTQVNKVIAEHAKLWRQGLEITLEDLMNDQVLPSNIYLLGGGSLLPEIHNTFEESWNKKLFFEKKPKAEIVLPEMFKIKDASGLVNKVYDGPVIALSFLTNEIPEEDMVSRAVQRVSRMLEI